MLSGKKGPEQQAAAKKVLPFFPNQGDRGTHMNISGGGVLKMHQILIMQKNYLSFY